MNWFQGFSFPNISLINGPLPTAVAVMAAASLIYLLIHRSLRWWIFVVVSALSALLISRGACWTVIHWLFWWPEDLPTVVVLILALVLWVVALGVAALRSGKHARKRTLAAVATAVVLGFAGLATNVVFGQYPTVGTLFGSQVTVSTTPLPGVRLTAAQRFMQGPVTQRWQPPARLPAAGTVKSIPIPGLESGFQARNAVVYLPPAYQLSNRPVLPVLVLVSGQPGSPESWLRSTGLVAELDDYAGAHDGLAPLVVVPDPNGGEQKNTLCMDSFLARADTYMAVDVPQWIKTHLDADTNPAHWAVGGFSFGATCAVQMVTRHPGTYQTFMAIAPEREPALAVSRSVTVERAFHGDTAAFNALLPLTLLAVNRYPQIHGWFVNGSMDAAYAAHVTELQTAARKAGMTTERAVFPGGHSWSVANEALPRGLAFIQSRLGLP